MTQVPEEIRNVLTRFRRWIRRYILLEGLAVLVAVSCLMFWVTFLLDVAYFRVSNLELPSSLRLVILLLMAGSLSGLAITWVLLRLFHQLRFKDLALALERKFPQLRDQLITTIEEDQGPATPLHNQMLEQTRREAAEKVSRLPLEETFDRGPLKRALIVATVLLTTSTVFSIANAASVERWVNAYLLTRENYWDPFRKQSLTLKVIAQPGETVKEFDENGIYRHPRGADLQLIVESRDESSAPDAVTLQYYTLEGNSADRGRVSMNRAGVGKFRHSFSRLVNDHRLWIRGGDYINRVPYLIQIVEPPQVDSMRLACDYPTYTGMDGLEDQEVAVVGTQVSLPMETKFTLHTDCNKPIRSVNLRSERFHLKFGLGRADDPKSARPTTLELKDEDNRVVKTLEVNAAAGTLLTDDGSGFQVPFVITAQAEELWNNMQEPVELPIPIPQDSSFSIFLEDQDDIYSPEPATLIINGIVDQPPVVDTRRTGVSSIVTRNAMIPIEGTLKDDYGVVSGWFGYQVASREGEETRPLANLPTGQKEYRLNDVTDRSVERFDLRPLKLQEGDRLTLGVYAEDGDDLNGPHVAHGELFTFNIVTNDELMSRLFEREVNLRLRFEQIRSEVNDLKTMLEDQLAKFQGTEAPVNESQELSSFVERSLHQLRKNQTESRSIEISFKDLREEMVNNGLDTREKLGRIDNGVITPLIELNDNLFVTADQRYALQRLNLEQQENLRAAMQETVPAVDAVLSQMDRILDEMKDRGTINDVIQNLQSLIEKQRKLMEQAEEKRIEENFFFDFNE